MGNVSEQVWETRRCLSGCGKGVVDLSSGMGVICVIVGATSVEMIQV